MLTPAPDERRTAADGAVFGSHARARLAPPRAGRCGSRRTSRPSRRRPTTNFTPCAPCMRARARRTAAPCASPPEAVLHQEPHRAQPAHSDRTSRAARPCVDRARCQGDFAELSARLSVRDVARPRHRGLGRRRQSVPRFHVAASPYARRATRIPIVVEAVKTGSREIPAHLERLLAREHGRAG